MLKRLRTAHPIVFCVLAEVAFLASLFVTDLIFTIVLVLLRADFSALDTYLYSTLQELVGALVAVLTLVKMGWQLLEIQCLVICFNNKALYTECFIYFH